MNRLEIDKNSLLYELTDVVIEPSFGTSQDNFSRAKIVPLAELVKAYKELENLKWLKHELEYISKYIQERFKHE